MKLLCTLLITLVAAMQNFQLTQGHPFQASSRKLCSPECEFKYFRNLHFQNRMWANVFLPLPTSQNDWNETCSRTTSFLACSELKTAGCRKGWPPMVRLAQIRDAYGYMCNEGSSKFLQVVDCLNKNYKQNEMIKCIEERKNTKPKGPDGDFCITLENAQNCAVEKAMKKCGQTASDFMSTFVQETHKEMKESINCDKFKVQTTPKPQRG